jgi:hypothetical protein
MNCNECPELKKIDNDPTKKLCDKNKWEFSNTLAEHQRLCGTTPTDWTENLTEAKLA